MYRGSGYSGGTIFTYTSGVGATNSFGNYNTLATIGTLTAGNQATAPSTLYMQRSDALLAASSARDYSVAYMFGNGGFSGPWCSLFSAAAVSGSTSGYSMQTMLYLGSRGARTHAVTLQNQNVSFLSCVLQSIAEHSGYTTPSDLPLLVRVSGGINDSIYEAGKLSVGPNAGLDSSTSAGIVDNWQAIIDRIKTVYSTNGWSTNNLYWLFTPSAPYETGDTSVQPARAAANTISDNNTNTASVNLYQLTDGLTGVSNDIYGLAARQSNGTPDYAHHTVTGFRIYSTVEWGSIQAAYNAYVAAPGASNPASTNGVWFAGKIYTPSQYQKIIESFYPNLLR
jgi:hypothetical protein